MRIFAVSDLHIDYNVNKKWLFNISKSDFTDDILILAGDIIDITQILIKAFVHLKRCFKEVLYVPGNHDLWVHRAPNRNSFEKFDLIKTIADNCGILMKPTEFGPVTIVPLFGWYDYSFGKPNDMLLDIWLDYLACHWPDNYDETKITDYFISLNKDFLSVKNQYIISFSHFLPRIDIMPDYIPPDNRILYPVLGAFSLEKQIRKLGSIIHVYGHSHVNARSFKDNTRYINNAYGYPSESRITAKQLLNIFEI